MTARRMVSRRARHADADHSSGPAPEVALDPRAARRSTPRNPSLVDAVVYHDGRIVARANDLAEAYRVLRQQPGAMTWIDLCQPQSAQLLAAAEEFELHELVVEDTIVAHQRPKLERYGDTLFVVLRSADYVDDAEEVEFGEIHLFVGHDYVLTVRHSRAPDLSAVRRRLEADPGLLSCGPEAVLYAVLDAVVDGYAPVVAGLQNDIDEIETEVFVGHPHVSKRIYALSREVIEFQRATRPLLDVLGALMAGFGKYGIAEELQSYLRDVADHATTVVERVAGFRQMLGDILAVNASLVAQAQNQKIERLTEASYDQNEQVKRISAWAAILFAPTVVGTVYGMNFTHMPELRWVVGYPLALALMALVCAGLYREFKRRGWL